MLCLLLLCLPEIRPTAEAASRNRHRQRTWRDRGLEHLRHPASRIRNFGFGGILCFAFALLTRILCFAFALLTRMLCFACFCSTYQRSGRPRKLLRETATVSGPWGNRGLVRLRHPASCGDEVGFGILNSAKSYALLAFALLTRILCFACFCSTY